MNAVEWMLLGACVVCLALEARLQFARRRLARRAREVEAWRQEVQRLKERGARSIGEMLNTDYPAIFEYPPKIPDLAPSRRPLELYDQDRRR